MLVHELLEHAARRRPDATALVCGADRLSYGELNDLAQRLAVGLRRRGVARGDRVVILLDNSAESVISIFGTLKAGAAFTVLNASTKCSKLTGILTEEHPAALIATWQGQVGRTLDGVPAAARPPVTIVVGESSWSTLLTGVGACRPVAGDPDDLGCIIWTSGTSGAPKGVMSLHRDMTFAATTIAEYLENTAADVILCPLSLGFTYGLYQLLTAVAVGATLVLEKGFTFPQHALEIMQRARVTGLPGVPTMFSLLLRQDVSRYDLRSLRYVTNAAAAMPISQVQDIGRLFPGARFFSMYGQTECKRACFLPPEELAARPGSVGRALAGTEACVVDTAGHPLPAGQVGELVVRGPHLMSGYWNRPQDTAQRLRPGPDGAVRLHTGDLFRSDADGYLYFVSRADDMIKCRGEKVNPAEVEDVVRELPGVVEVAAVGVADPLQGEVVKVYVVTERPTTLTSRAVRSFCAHRLEDFMVPSLVEFCEHLPTNDNGKLLRRKLRTCAA